MPTDNYDVLVIGSGPGGYVAAIRAAQLGQRTALVEKSDVYGGTCLNVGCIPTKALLHNAEVYDYLKEGKEYGLECGSLALDWAAVQARKDRIVKKHGKGVEFLLKKNKVEMLRGFARLAGGGCVDITEAGAGNGSGARQVAARAIILASGSEARLLPGLSIVPGRVLTNIEVLQLPQLPKSMAIIGAGAVGCEFASIFHAFGTQVTLLEMLPRIVPFEDEEVSKELQRLFKKRGINVETGAKVEKVTPGETACRVEFTVNGKARTVEAEALLVAVGRKPNTETIGLEKTKARAERGFVVVDEYQQTDEPGLYAIGDIVAGYPQLAHVASMQGLVAAARIAGKPARPLRRDRIPAVTYTHPEVASVGLTETQARERGHAVKTGKFPFAANSRASILGRPDGFIKIVADAQHGEVLGVHMIGPLVSELIAEGVMALELEATIDEFMWTIHAHPTLSEALWEAGNTEAGMTINA